ncbi:MAG TPA: hypothetical protein DD490_10045 [Acidobacteria bacterium]|nr:hypothetical protein [Acidobacteriota bacterium]
MTHEQYTQHKSQLDEQLRAGIQLLEAAHQAQVRALDFVWMLQSGTGLAAPAAPVQAAAPREAVPPPARSQPQEYLVDLVADVRQALPDLPELFTGADVSAALGRKPERTALYRALRQLLQDGHAVLETPGSGRQPAVYRKTEA